MNSSEDEKPAPWKRDSTEVEKAQNHDVDSDVDGTSLSATSSAPSLSEEEQQQQQRQEGRTSNTLSRHVSETEVRDGFQNQRDPELGPALTEKIDTTAPDPNNPNLVTWTGPDDPQNPKNWKYSKKWAAVFIVSLFAFISPTSSSLVAPALDSIADELGITQDCKSKPPSPLLLLSHDVISS